jgi:hypothetical protein
MSQMAVAQIRKPAQSSSAQASGVLQRKCDKCRKKKPLLQRAAVSSAPETVPPIVHEVLRSPGQPLDASTRAFMEPRFVHDFSGMRAKGVTLQAASANLKLGAAGDRDEHEASLVAAKVTQMPAPVVPAADFDFSAVRVHADERAAKSAQAIRARAYAAGSHIVFAPGEYAPIWGSGRHLLAHELAHTTQFGSEKRVARVPVTGYETKPVQFVRADIEKMVGISYWEQTVGAKYAIKFINTVQGRFKADPEERDAALSILWQRRPTSTIASDTIVTVSIPARQSTPKSKALLYQFKFTPAPKKGGQEGVQIDLIAEDSQAVVSAATVPPAGYIPPSLSKNTSGFPVTSDDYFRQHPDEHKQLYYWIESASSPQFEQIVTTTENPPKGKKHDSSYHVKGMKSTMGKLTSLDIDLLTETPVFIDKPPTDYANKDASDVELEKAQAKKADKLGQVSGLTNLPADEQLSVKYAIWQYFEGGTRNKEVDTIIPIAKKAQRVFYTLRFQPGTNNVDVERVGEEGSSVKLTAATLNITRVEGFAANSADPATFKAWLSKRYPSVMPQGTTLADLQAGVNKQMETDVSTIAWFKKNYGIEILDAAAAETRLQTVYKLSSAETADLKSFTPDDLKRLEFALETMSDAGLAIVKGTQMARQKVLIELKGANKKTATPDPVTGGITCQSGLEKTIIIFDTATGNEQQLFAGGASGVRPASVQTYVHEFGHVLATQAKLEKPFADFVKKRSIKPTTWYAASKPATESFPEAFALFQTDPEWMKVNLPELFAWFEEVKKTGKPPSNP